MPSEQNCLHDHSACIAPLHSCQVQRVSAQFWVNTDSVPKTAFVEDAVCSSLSDRIPHTHIWTQVWFTHVCKTIHAEWMPLSRMHDQQTGWKEEEENLFPLAGREIWYHVHLYTSGQSFYSYTSLNLAGLTVPALLSNPTQCGGQDFVNEPTPNSNLGWILSAQDGPKHDPYRKDCRQLFTLK